MRQNYKKDYRYSYLAIFHKLWLKALQMPTTSRPAWHKQTIK